ncbi:MAG TPA: tetratricopeptide repeat protein [Cytophagaceae bacterium]|jgi:tetratricopeptide (TPR) repeat protein|nr:tetratricopeptide repeat protein [Cytophagaceae bacterium]
MSYQQGDLLYTKIDNRFHVSKILRYDKYLGTYHICGYAPLDHRPTTNDIPNLQIAIAHSPVAAFPEAVLITNQPVIPDELNGYLEYLTMIDFAGYLQLTKQDSNTVVALANELYTKAYYLTDDKKYEEAIDFYTQAFEAFPLFHEALDNRAFAKMHLARWTSAINDFKLSLYLSPGSTLAEFSIGECYLRMKDYAAAKAQFQKTLRIDPTHELSREFLEKTLALMNV